MKKTCDNCARGETPIEKSTEICSGCISNEEGTIVTGWIPMLCAYLENEEAA